MGTARRLDGERDGLDRTLTRLQNCARGIAAGRDIAEEDLRTVLTSLDRELPPTARGRRLLSVLRKAVPRAESSVEGRRQFVHAARAFVAGLRGG